MLRKHLTLMLTTLALAATLTGCGGAGSVATTAPATFGTTTGNQVQAQDYRSVTQAQRVATDSLYRYEDLRRDWDRAYSDREKDRIEMQMLDELTEATKECQSISSGGYGYDAREVYDITDRALDEYETLRGRWQRTYDTRQKREIVNDMLQVLTQSLKLIQQVRPRG